MTTAHRPTFDPARGKEALRGPAYHQRLLPAYTYLKTRQQGQGTEGETARRDLRAELLAAEAVHFAKTNGIKENGESHDNDDTKAIEAASHVSTVGKRKIEERDVEDGSDSQEHEEEDSEAKRRRILEETRELDADSTGSEDESSDEEEDDDESEDETAELMRELEKIKKERAEQREREEQERAAAEEEKKEREIALGNPLLNPQDFSVKRRWDDDVIFKNQARGTETKRKEFVNDLQRSEFHKKFLNKYVK